MGLLAVVENLDTVAEADRQHYSEVEGVGYQLSVEPVGNMSLTDVSGLKSALEKERANAKSLGKKLGDAADLDISAARDALSKVEAMKDWKPDEKVQEQIKAKMGEQKALFDKDLEKLASERDALFNQVDLTLRQAEAQKVLSEFKGNSTLLMPHILSQTQVVKGADGSFSSVVVDAAGNPRVGGNDGSNMTVRQLVENMFNDAQFSGAFEASGNKGTGATGATNRGATAPGKKLSKENFDNLDPKSQGKFFRDGGTIS